jgi:hypothetical protein
VLSGVFSAPPGDPRQQLPPLTHATLAELVAARRPSVTTAVTRLHERGVLTRESGGWRLRGTVPPELLVGDLAGDELDGARQRQRVDEGLRQVPT